MGYWKRLVAFHQNDHKKFPTGEEGFKAINFLRFFFEKMGCNNLSPNHPLHNRLGVGFEPNYLWLVQYAKKLQKASQFSGFEQIAKRLVNPRTYLASQNEIEVALKLHLDGLDVSFPCLGSEHTPDLILRLGNEITRIEVSSLNPSDEEMRFQLLRDLVARLSFSFEMTSGGFFSRIPSVKAIKEIENQLAALIEESKKLHKMEKLTLKGIATIYLASNDLADQIPDDCRRSFQFVGPSAPKPIEHQIRQKIENKSEQLFNDDESGILFLYTQMINRENVFQLFKSDMDNIVAILASYPRVLGLVLTVPHLGLEVVSGSKPIGLTNEFKGNKILLECEAGAYQYESIIVWKNLHAKSSFPNVIICALKNYASNLSKLRLVS
jgi:hypothetical protein